MASVLRKQQKALTQSLWFRKDLRASAAKVFSQNKANCSLNDGMLSGISHRCDRGSRCGNELRGFLREPMRNGPREDLPRQVLGLVITPGLRIVTRDRQFVQMPNSPFQVPPRCGLFLHLSTSSAEFPGTISSARRVGGLGLRRRHRSDSARMQGSHSSRMARPASAPKTKPSSRELLARRLAPCTPVAAASPAAYRPGNDGAAVEIGANATHGVVRRGPNRNKFGGDVDVVLQAGRVDARETSLYMFSASRWVRSR